MGYRDDENTRGGMATEFVLVSTMGKAQFSLTIRLGVYMNDGEMIMDLMRQARQQTLAASSQWRLGQLIDALLEIDADEDCTVSFAFGNFIPTTCDSYRGSYAELAIGFVEGYPGPKLSEFIAHLTDCVGREFAGYKGGEFVMDRSTPLWVANYGNSGCTGVVGIHPEVGANGKAYMVYIRTDYCQF